MNGVGAITASRWQAWSAEARATIVLAWPLILTNLAQTAMTTTDVLLMGQLGPDALAAGALGSNLYFATTMFGLGLTTATAPMIARELGRKSHSVRDVRRTVRQGMWAAVVIAVPIWIVLWHSETILLAMGQRPDLALQAGDYVRTLQWSVLPFFFYLVLRSFISALQRPQWGLVIGVAGVAVNAFTAWGLIFGHLGLPRLGLVGAGIATTLADLFMFATLAIVISLDRKFRRYRLFGRFWRADWPRFVELWRLGMPIGATLVFEVAVFNASTFLMGLIGEESIAAHSIALQIASLSFMVPLGLSQAATVRVGRAFGAKDADGVRRAGWTALAMGTSFMTMAALVMVTMPRLLIGAFLDLDLPSNAPVARLAVSFLALAALFQLVDGGQAVAAGVLRGLHDTRMPMIYAALGYWGIGLVVGVVLAFVVELQGIGIWIGLAAGLTTVAILLLTRWLRRDRLGLLACAA
ncbi:MATE family efflux transporter [Enhydrobacter sp.]|jgi:MATE family multidrug resistance protein|uniref:MATE family efflux transporter n=1 Tax=Enhydrobacter sp. TaxID=1894999 RepID=UPI00261761F9|nr:MATE family efflux transporter [Enhydrobacter sp.]WIM11640.1 MAG: MATE family efflux pump [Enhydrobacter sp.]